MDNAKPFKTIEVIDARTRQLCKVACMSCIRGHRTTSCGIPVCRTKIFWTVKRPGRPSNSCTCRYGATGGCKCVVAKPVCPHKTKKGEKRAGECRCDEQGRYCCLIEPEHWTALLALQNPAVTFFKTREALETRQVSSTTAAFPAAPAYVTASPRLPNGTTGIAPSTPNMRPMHGMPQIYNGFHTPSTSLTPRFGMVGLSAQLGPEGDIRPDVLAWETPAPVVPQELNPQYMFADVRSEQGPCCGGVTSPTITSIRSPPSYPSTPSTYAHPMQASVSSPPIFSPEVHAAIPQPAATPAFDFSRLQTDYFNYQFPSAICQNCGLNGCTCRNCPPVFQNFGNTTWGQYCGRKHAREAVQPTLPVLAPKIPRTETWNAQHGLHGVSAGPSTVAPREAFTPMSSTRYSMTSDGGFEDFHDSGMILTDGGDGDFPTLDLDPDLMMTDGGGALNLNEFLVPEADRLPPIAVLADDDDDRGGGCCCGG